MSDVETLVTPPDADEDEGGDIQSARLSASWLDVDTVYHEASLQLFEVDATDPDKFADALLRAALAVAQLVGPDFAWAAARRFATYDGSTR